MRASLSSSSRPSRGSARRCSSASAALAAGCVVRAQPQPVYYGNNPNYAQPAPGYQPAPAIRRLRVPAGPGLRRAAAGPGRRWTRPSIRRRRRRRRSPSTGLRCPATGTCGSTVTGTGTATTGPGRTATGSPSRPGYVFIGPRYIYEGGRPVYYRGYWQGSNGYRDYSYRAQPQAGWRGTPTAAPAGGWRSTPPAAAGPSWRAAGPGPSRGAPPPPSSGWRGTAPAASAPPPSGGWRGDCARPRDGAHGQRDRRRARTAGGAPARRPRRRRSRQRRAAGHDLSHGRQPGRGQRRRRLAHLQPCDRLGAGTGSFRRAPDGEHRGQRVSDARRPLRSAPVYCPARLGLRRTGRWRMALERAPAHSLAAPAACPRARRPLPRPAAGTRRPRRPAAGWPAR